jgi:hypothetical protein
MHKFTLHTSSFIATGVGVKVDVRVGEIGVSVEVGGMGVDVDMRGGDVDVGAVIVEPLQPTNNNAIK